MKASGNIEAIGQQLTFWRTAYKCHKLMLFQKLVKILLRKRQIEWIDKNVVKGTTLSELSN